MHMNLKAGDEVGISRMSQGTVLHSVFGHVVKINGHGHIYVDAGSGEYRRFDKQGNSYKDQYGPSLIAADKLREILAASALRKRRARAVREIEDTLKSGWNYSGDWFPSEERMKALRNLVDELENIG